MRMYLGQGQEFPLVSGYPKVAISGFGGIAAPLARPTISSGGGPGSKPLGTERWKYGVATRWSSPGSKGMAGSPNSISGVARVNDFGSYKELRIEPGAEPQRILRELTQLGTIQHFELARPSLHDIFVRIAGPGAEQTQELINA